MHAHCLRTLAGLQPGEMLGLIMHVQDLFLALLVEGAQALTGGSVTRLLEVRGQAPPAFVGPLGDPVLLVNRLRPFRSLVLRVEILQGFGEALAHTVLLVHLDGTLHDIVAEDVAVGEVFGDDACAWLFLLRDIFLMFLARAGALAAGHLLQRSCRGDMDLTGAELGVVQEEGGLRRRLFLERDRCGLARTAFAALWGHREALDLAAGFPLACVRTVKEHLNGA